VQLVSSFFIVCFKQYCPPMFLDSLTSTLTSNTPGSIITSTSHHESNTHVSSSNRSETGVITSSSGSAPDIISLDWNKRQHWSSRRNYTQLLLVSLELQHLWSYSDIYWKDLPSGKWSKFIYIRDRGDRTFLFSCLLNSWYRKGPFRTCVLCFCIVLGKLTFCCWMNSTNV